MAVVAAVDPIRIAAIVVMLTRRQPIRHLVAYLIGGFGVSLLVGAVVLFALEGIGVGSGSGIPGEIEVGVAILALLVAVLVGTGVADRIRSKRQKSEIGSGAGPADANTATEVPQGIDQLAAFQKLPKPIQQVLRSESAWVGWIAGVAIGMPSAYYLAAIAAILGAGVGVPVAVAALVLFNVIAFALAEVFLVRYLAAPEETAEHVRAVYVWTQQHHRAVVAGLAALVGIYLLIVGFGKL